MKVDPLGGGGRTPSGTLPTYERLTYLFEDVGDTVKRRVPVQGNYTLQECRCVNSNGYYVVRVDGKLHYVHRVLWVLRTGDWPTHEIDHIDGVRLNNAADNLREVTSAENSWNMPVPHNNTSGYLGASWCRASRSWRGTIKVRGKWLAKTGFTEPKHAHEWYLQKAKELRNGFRVENKQRP